MMSDPLFLVILVLVGAVLGVLVLGIGSFGKGGDFNRKHSNRLMRWRLGLQFAAVVLIVLFVWLRSQGG
jgi:NADH:ubiquinone oxidoreductase subunit 6 (subunit J)